MPNEKELDSQERKEIAEADAKAKTMQDFTSPEVLYKELIESVRKYHPSDDISLIEESIQSGL